MKRNSLHINIIPALLKQKLVFVLGGFIMLLTYTANAQSDKKIIRDANKNYNNKQYDEAEKNYLKALQKNKNSYAANYNLANTLYQKGKYADAVNYFQGLTHIPTSKDTLHRVYHNLGNALLKQQKFEEAVNAYKNALKQKQNDEDTRYNLAYAQAMLKQQNQNKNNDKNDKKENKEDKQDNQNKNNDKDKKDNKDKDNKKDKDKQQQESPPQNQLSKEDAQRMLDALQNDEKNVRNKLKPKAKVGVRVQIEKDW
jgi:Ca-activated chloride channel homolog